MADVTQITMTAQEFRRLPETTQPTELIHGEIIVSPTPRNPHQTIVLATAVFLKTTFPNGTTVIAPMDVYLDSKNVVQPDVFWVNSDQCKLGEDGYWYGAPDLVIEVLSPSTELRDRKTKFALYEKHGVREYWLIDPELRFVEVYWLVEGVLLRKGVFDASETLLSAVLGSADVSVGALL